MPVLPASAPVAPARRLFIDGLLAGLYSRSEPATAVSLLETIEGTVNIIWNAPTRRGLLQKYAGYLALIIVCPMLALAAVSLTGALQSQEVVRWLLGLRLLGTDVQWTYLLIGVLIISAVAIDQWIRKVAG